MPRNMIHRLRCLSVSPSSCRPTGPPSTSRSARRAPRRRRRITSRERSVLVPSAGMDRRCYYEAPVVRHPLPREGGRAEVPRAGHLDAPETLRDGLTPPAPLRHGARPDDDSRVGSQPMQCSLRSTRTAPRRTRRTAPLLRAIFTAALVLAGGQALGLVQGLGIAQAQTAQAQTAPAGAEAPRPGSETSGESQRKAQSIARRTMSPFCPGRTLADCPSEHAAAWRREIQVMLDEGRTAQEIQEEFERRAGGDLSGSPNRAAGYGLSLGLAAASL